MEKTLFKRIDNIDHSTYNLYLEDIGNSVQVVGVIMSNGNEDYSFFLPNSLLEDNQSHQIELTDLEWKTLIKQSDNPAMAIMDESGRIVKSIIQKNARHVQEIFRWGIFRRDNYTCQYCSAIDRPLTIDEYLCQELGGPINESNCRAACRPCNKAKANKTPSEWEIYRKQRGWKAPNE